jgi:nucleoside-diphosphate-sugar epimerase
MKVLFLGGTGNISTACVERALALGYQVTVLNRGNHPLEFSRPVAQLIGDRNDPLALAEAVAQRFDVVANFLGYTPDEVQRDIAAFGGWVGQYVYISSASAYCKPLPHYIVTEETPLANPYWQYARDKIACEEALFAAYRASGFPVTVVRPSYTYGETWIPNGVGGHGYVLVARMRQGKPVISAGDGQTMWVMTHNSDFAVGFVGLFGQQAAIGEAFHITSDEVLTWDAIYRTIAQAAGCEVELLHLSTDFIAAICPEMGPGLYGDKANSVVFDNAKIKRFVPEFNARVSLAEGMARSIAWHDADPVNRHIYNTAVDARFDRLVAAHRQAIAGA